MRSIRRSAVFLVVTALVGAACGSNGGGGGGGTGGGGGGKPQSGGDVIIARTAESQSMDKTNVYDNESIWIATNLYEMLYEAGPDGKSLLPWLATGHEFSSDQLTWTFHLRPGVKFHNGQPLTGADVVFSLDEARGRTAPGDSSTRPSRRSRRPTRLRSSSRPSTHGRRCWPTCRCSATASSRRTTPARAPRTSTRRPSAPAPSCGITGPRARS